MTNIVERLRKLGGDGSTGYGMPIASEAADRIAELERELAAETNNKQEFERDWLACCDKLNDERRIHLELEEILVKKLEAAQARERMLRDTLERLACLGNGDKHGNSVGNEIAIDALAQPTDDTALQNLIVYERLDAVRSYQTMYEKLMLPDLLKTERERVAKHFESRSYLGSGHQLAIEIRALEDE